MKKHYKDDSYLDEFKPLEVIVEDRVEDAIPKFRSLVTKERIMSVLKQHHAYEKPSEKKRRKRREAEAARRKANAPARKQKSRKERDTKEDETSQD